MRLGKHSEGPTRPQASLRLYKRWTVNWSGTLGPYICLLVTYIGLGQVLSLFCLYPLNLGWTDIKNKFPYKYYQMLKTISMNIEQCLFYWRVSIEIRCIVFWSLSKAVTALPVAGSCFISVLLFSEGDCLSFMHMYCFVEESKLAFGLLYISLFSSLNYLLLTMTFFLTQV